MRMATALVILCVLLLYVWERIDVVHVGYRVEQLKAKKVDLERERDELRLKIATLTAPDRIARTATAKLGMMPPHQGQVRLVRLDPDGPSPGTFATTEVRLAKHEPARMR